MAEGASVGLGFQAVLKDFGMGCSIALKSDASAAIAIASRRGFSKVTWADRSTAAVAPGKGAQMRSQISNSRHARERG